ncbi:MAG TPA: pyruvate kinase, partial [Gaiellaceae bacterium]|nr:pyruvate kinase [Gaiellaceae bacterium]
LATIGPVSTDKATIERLVDAGMNAARLNFSHGTHDDHAERARLVREVQDESGWRTLALVADLQGPKLRLGDLDAPVELLKGEEVVVAGEEAARDGDLPVAPAVVGDVLQPGHDVLVDDGLVRLRVEAVERGRARCTVVVGGTVSSHKGVNLPGVPLPIPALTRKDLADLDFALELGVDFVALSFVRSAADVRDLRRLLEERGSRAYVIAKIEKAEAVDALDDILAETHGVMVARGDLGVEIGPESVPLIQKRIIERALRLGVPVITATQMLESMIHQAEPTRAEASDVANAILDGTSAVMLSGETAVGEFPVEAVQVMDRIARAVEPHLGYRHQMPDASEEPGVGRAMSNAACDLAEALGATAILVPTFSGKTASAVARLRPRRPILGLSHQRESLQHMALEWGVTPLEMPETNDVEDLWKRSIETARESGVVAPGDRIVITAGTAVNLPGSTNVIKVDVV